MTDTHLAIIVSAAQQELLQSIATALIGSDGSGMFTAGVSPSGFTPATHFIGAGFMPEALSAALASPAALLAACTDKGLSITQAQCDTLLAQTDVSTDSGFGALDRLQLKPAVAPVVPAAITMRQARLVLLGAGKLGTVNALIAGMPGAQGEAARIEWEFSSEVRRQQPLILALAPALGLTTAQIDALFVAGGAL